MFDVDMLLTPQGVATGGRDTGAELWGTAEYTLGVDTQKLGLWPGGYLNVYALSSFGSSVNRDSGAIVPVNTATLLPASDDPGTALMNLTFMQFLSKEFGLVAGKLYTLTGDDNAFAHNYRTTFMNTGLDFNLVLALAPFSVFGGGFVVLPWEGAQFTVSAIDPSGSPTSNDLGDAFADGVLVSGEGRVAIKPFGLVGHQLLGFIWSNKERLSLRQDPSNIARLFLTEQFPRLSDPGPLLIRILERFFPELLVPTVPAQSRERHLGGVLQLRPVRLESQQGDPTQGIGVFFRFGLSDGVANPIKYAYNVGIGGKGMVPGRPKDTFGVGWSRVEFSDNLVPFLRQRLGLGLDREDAVELYYNAAIIPWLGASLDLQIIQPGLKKTLDSSGQLRDMNTAVVPGFRLYARF